MLMSALAGTLACAGKPEINFAWDKTASFANLKTYAWYTDPKFQMPHGGSIVDGRFVDERVRAAVERDLEKKGYVKGQEGTADIHVVRDVRGRRRQSGQIRPLRLGGP